MTLPPLEIVSITIPALSFEDSKPLPSTTTPEESFEDVSALL